MEAEQPEKEEEPQQRSKRGSEVQPMDYAAHMNKPKDRCFKSIHCLMLLRSGRIAQC